MKEDDYLVGVFSKIAADRGVTLDDLFNQMMEMLELINKPLPPDGRLAYTENLLREKRVGKDQADLILRNNPLLKPEVRALIGEAQETLGRKLGLEIPDYRIIFDPRLNRTGSITDFVDPIEQTITIASEGSVFTPVLVGHILGHVFQDENSNVMRELREAYKRGGVEGYNGKYEGVKQVIEGWAVFLSRQYAIQRDAQLGFSFYVPLEEELRGWIGLTRYMQTKEITNEYQQGYELYQQIFERHGMIGAVWAARFITSDEHLRSFASDETVTFK